MLTGTSLCLTTDLWGVCCCTLVCELWELLSRQELKEGAHQHTGTHRHFGISPAYRASSLPREMKEEHKELLCWILIMKKPCPALSLVYVPAVMVMCCTRLPGQAGAANLAFC